MKNDTCDALGAVRDYYSSKVLEHGATSRGVDWNSEQTQDLRFAQLARILPPPPQTFSLADLGCGYGGLLSYLRAEGLDFDFIGIDVSPEMIAEAERQHAATPRRRFVVGAEIGEPVDYVIASGIFNVRQETTDAAWRAHIFATIDEMDRAARRGFAFNCLTNWSDRDKMRDYLYYSDPSELFAYCMRKSRHVALLHDYGLYEFTILVSK